MAFIEKKRVAEVRAELKKTFPGFKFSVTRVHYSKINIAIVAGPLDFFDDNMRTDKLYRGEESQKLSDYDKAKKHTTVNQYWIKDRWTGKAGEMLQKIADIALVGNYNRNAGDLGADYADYNFFVDIAIGKWDKPYQLVQAA